jgi:hypothetical protein
MLSFELTAIDLILVLSVIVMLILYMTKMSTITPEKKQVEKTVEKKDKTKFFKKFTNPSKNSIDSLSSKFEKQLEEKPSQIDQTYTIACPRGFGYIEMLGSDNSVSQKCLGCYKIMECYLEHKVEN